MRATTDDIHEGPDPIAPPLPEARGGARTSCTPCQKRRLPVKKSHANPPVTDARTLVPTGGPLPLMMGRWGMRGIGHFTAEELARLHQKLHGWIRQRAHDPERPQHRPWVRHPPRVHSANRRETP
jgi:hypothetical protein